MIQKNNRNFFKNIYVLLLSLITFILNSGKAIASEADLVLPNLAVDSKFYFLNNLKEPMTGTTIFYIGLIVAALGIAFGVYQYRQVKKMPVHKSMAEVSDVIWETCKTYLLKQGKFLLCIWVIIAICMFFYFAVLSKKSIPTTLFILLWSLIGMAGSYGVAWFGIRINNYANSRTSFASLKGKQFPVFSIPLCAGMSIGLLLVSVELLIMLSIFLFVDPTAAGACFIGFAIGESLGASVLRICGGIFTKIADIGADLMKIVFKIKEDDARNPGVIADCTGDNAGDSVGPTADGFETYGVTGVALIVFICLAVPETPWKADFIVWIFAIRFLMILTSILAYYVNEFLSSKFLKEESDIDFETPLTNLIWLSSGFAIIITILASFLLLGDYQDPFLWLKLAGIISCGTIAAAIIPEITKVFTSATSKHVKEVVNASKEGGPSLNILSGIVAGNFSAFWMGIILVGLMAFAWWISNQGLAVFFGPYYPVFAFGLVAFGLLGMGPVTIAVDSYGPVTDNAQSVYELSLIEEIPNIANEIKTEYKFEPQFAKAKYNLEKNDGAGNTFKATAKPVLIGTAVVGATAMIFSIIMMLEQRFGGAELSTKLSLLAPQNLLGFIAGGAVIYWFCGASMQAVTTGAHRAVEFIKKNIKLDGNCKKASKKDSTEVVAICTKYAQDGMVNIFASVFLFALGFACIDSFFFISYLISLALFGLYSAVYMANAGGAWDNAKKVVEVDLRDKTSLLHEASVVGDTVGDPFKDTSSVSLNPIIKFTTLFGVLAVEIAVSLNPTHAHILGLIFVLLGMFFVWKSFYKMRINDSDNLTKYVEQDVKEKEIEEEDEEIEKIEEDKKIELKKSEEKKQEENSSDDVEKPKKKSKKKSKKNKKVE